MASSNSKASAEAEKIDPEAEKIEPTAAADSDADVPGAGPNEIGAIDETSDQPADEPVEEEPQPEQSLEDACVELGIEPDKDGKTEVVLLTSLAGINVKAPGEKHSCDAAEAVRMIRAGFAKIS